MLIKLNSVFHKSHCRTLADTRNLYSCYKQKLNNILHTNYCIDH